MRLRPDDHDIFIHPFEAVFSGFSGSGKTTLLTKLTKELKGFDVGYLKHDAHGFEIDRQGKDTFAMREAGAKFVLINDESSFAYLKNTPLCQATARTFLTDTDLLLIEGHKSSPLPKMLVYSNDTKTLTFEALEKGEIKAVKAFIGESPPPVAFSDKPYFHRDDFIAIKQYLFNVWKKRAYPKLRGLVLAGGFSKRMGTPKGDLNYHGQTQIDRTVALASSVCDEVFVSCRREQLGEEVFEGHRTIADRFPGRGPSAGILSAQWERPESAWLVLGCDMPLIDKATIGKLVNERNPYKVATCYLNPARGWPEPLCAIYEPKSRLKLMEYLAQNKACPRKVLFDANIKTLTLKNKTALFNANTPKQRQQALELINKAKINGDETFKEGENGAC